jgi:hypothetical protein
MYEALDVVSRELVGLVPAVSRDSKADGAAVDQTVRSPVVPAMTAADITASNATSTGTDRVMDYVDVAITKSRKVSFNLTGEQRLSLGENNGAIARDSFAQAFRTLANEVESDLAALYVAASRAHGTAATAPFGTAGDLSDAAGVRRILEDNGAPTSDLQLVLGAAAMANIRGKQSVLFKVNEAGTDDLLRRGVIGMLEGFNLRNSRQIKAHTKGTGSGYLINVATTGEVAGQTTLTVDTGTGTILAGDIVTFAGTSDKYVVTTALSGGTTLVIAKPGLLVTEADDDALTVGNSYTANMAFSRNAIQLVTRTPAQPEGGDIADDRVIVQDPVSGLAFEVALYRQYRQVSWEVGIAWGVKVVKPEHLALLIG